MGMIAVHSYSVTIFLESGAGVLSAEGAAAVYGCIQIMGALSVTSLIERSGRKVRRLFGLAITDTVAHFVVKLRDKQSIDLEKCYEVIYNVKSIEFRDTTIQICVVLARVKVVMYTLCT